MVPSPPLQSSSVAIAPGSSVAAVTFCRLECDHKELFQLEYKRSNRTKGLKILRCFPHCCPTHMDRSYCGSSLHVLVHATKSLPLLLSPTSGPDSLGVGKLAVFARFESSSDPGLEPGECISVDSIAAGTQSEENPEGQWIPGLRERPSVLQTSSKCDPQLQSENAAVFQLNGKIYSRWYYDWESGANKAQRLMKHVLKAYVFEKCGIDANGQLVTTLTSTTASIQSYLWRVVAVITSPEFTVISYRRAPTEGLVNARGDAPVQAITMFNAPPPQPLQQQARMPSPTSSSTGERHLKHALGSVEASSSKDDDRWGDRDDSDDPRSMKRRRPTDSFVRPVATSFRIPSSSVASSAATLSSTNAFEDRVLWEHAHTGAVLTSKNLALLYWFAHWTPLTTYAPFVDELVHITHRKLLEPLAPATHPVGKINCFSRVLLDQAEWAAGPAIVTAATTRGVVLPYELEALLRVVAQATLWFYADDTRQWLRSFFQQHAAAAVDKYALRASFLVWLVQLEDALNQHVFVMTPLKSLAAVAEEIISVVYSYQQYHEKRACVRQVLGAHGFVGWTAFVAQLRDAYIASSTAPSTSSTSSAATNVYATAAVRNVFERGWNSEWLLDMEEAIWKPTDTASPGASAVSLAAVFDLISQLVRLDVALGVNERTLRIRATQSLAPGRDSMHLVLDGRERIFRVLPNGLSTSVGDETSGDYIGSIHMESAERLVVYLEVFRWATGATDRSHHVRMRIECWRNHRLYVNGEVLTTVSTASFADDERPYVSEMKLRAKRKAVTKAHARQHHAATAGGQNAPLPPVWKALGRFRLSYHRLGQSSL